MLTVPQGPRAILDTLTRCGHLAFVVGGCVRDSLLGRVPGDWDICTSALPEEVAALFPKTAPTGIAHGTVTVIWEGVGYEVTTFRTDGAYCAHRRPEQVTFVSSLEEDLLRRDFTVNAMALDGDGRLWDPYGGREDLARGLLRAVGEPRQRFEEDALRILRGLRFAAQLGFSLEEATVRAMEDAAPLLCSVSGERVYQELCKLITGPFAPSVLNRYPHILGTILPEILPALDFSQHNPHHHRSVWGHTVLTLEHTPADPVLRWTMLLHDLGKPAVFSQDARGVGHFYGHAGESARLAEDIFRRLRCDNHTRQRVVKLIAHHGDTLPTAPASLRRMLRNWSGEELTQLLAVKRADILGLHPEYRESGLAQLDRWEQLLRDTLAQQPCLRVTELEISGSDLLALGVEKGPRVGQLLRRLLEEVTEQQIENIRPALLTRAKTLIGKETL